MSAENYELKKNSNKPESNKNSNKTGLIKNGFPIDLTWRNVTVKAKEKIVLNRVSGQVRSGECVALMGPSGSGKSILSKVLAGVAPSNCDVVGEIFFNDEETTPAHMENLVSYVSQDFDEYPDLTVFEIVNYAANLKNKEGILERSMDVMIKMGLQENQTTKYKDLSGGEKLRVSLCMALLANTPIMILDEPTTGLDSQSAFIVLDQLKYLTSIGKTIIVSIHQPSPEMMGIFDGIILISMGEDAFHGKLEEGIKHFEEIGYKNDSETDPADFMLRAVSVDDRSEVDRIKTTNKTRNILEKWKKEFELKKRELIPFEDPRNDMAIPLAFILLKIDLRNWVWVVLNLILSEFFFDVISKGFSDSFKINFLKEVQKLAIVFEVENFPNTEDLKKIYEGSYKQDVGFMKAIDYLRSYSCKILSQTFFSRLGICTRVYTNLINYQNCFANESRMKFYSPRTFVNGYILSRIPYFILEYIFNLQILKKLYFLNSEVFLKYTLIFILFSFSTIFINIFILFGIPYKGSWVVTFSIFVKSMVTQAITFIATIIALLTAWSNEYCQKFGFLEDILFNPIFLPFTGEMIKAGLLNVSICVLFYIFAVYFVDKTIGVKGKYEQPVLIEP